MDRIQLNILSLSYSQTQTGAYALVLGEMNGKRRLPVIIGGFEAQAIVIELEKMKPSRPLTHDLFKTFADTFKIKIKEVIIYNLVEGIFFAKLICEHNGKTIELESRTSDAIALAVRVGCPVFTYEFILSTAGIILEEDVIKSKTKLEEVEDESIEPEKAKDIESLSITELKRQLKKAVENERYEEASRLRDEINRRKS